MTINANFPVLRPSINLDFANAKALDPRITFARASQASFFGADGLLRLAPANEARFDHDPVTGVSKGLLIEESRKNLYLYSEDFASSYWIKTNVDISPNVSVAPDGTLFADKLIATTADSVHYVYLGMAVTTGVTYVASFFVKSEELSKCMIQFYGTNGAFTNAFLIYDLTTGTVVGTPAASITRYGIDAIGAGWYRVWAASTAIETVQGNTSISLVNNAGLTRFVGDGISGLYVWGAQLEAGSFPTSYIPTTSAQATRAADVAQMTGTNFSSWYRQDEGTFVTESDTSAVTATDKRVFSANDGTTSNHISLHYGANSGGTLSSIILNAGIFQFGPNEGAYIANTPYLRAFAYKAGDPKIATKGALNVATAPSAIIPTVNKLDIGNRVNVQQLNGHVASLTYFPKRLSNAELQGLSA